MQGLTAPPDPPGRGCPGNLGALLVHSSYQLHWPGPGPASVEAPAGAAPSFAGALSNPADMALQSAGLVEPVKGGVEAGMRLGVGKAEEDDHYTAAENVVRKRLDIEVAAEEDEDQALKREVCSWDLLMHLLRLHKSFLAALVSLLAAAH